MTFERFLEKIKKSNISVDNKTGIPTVSIKWETGGVGGGSCYNACDNYYAVEGEEEPDFESFENLVLLFVPKILFVDFKRLEKKVMQSKSWTQSEYYGNSTTYTEKYAYLKDIYNFLYSEA